MQKELRIIELPPKPAGKLTPELGPAYERPLNRESVDARMKAQLAFEDIPQTSPNRRGKGSLIRKLAIGTMAVAGAAGTVLAIERAYDQQKTFYPPHTPGLTQDRHNR